MFYKGCMNDCRRPSTATKLQHLQVGPEILLRDLQFLPIGRLIRDWSLRIAIPLAEIPVVFCNYLRISNLRVQQLVDSLLWSTDNRRLHCATPPVSLVIAGFVLAMLALGHCCEYG